MTCRELMTAHPACCLAKDSVVTAAMIMKSHDVGSVPVVSDHDSRKIVGMVTDRDLTLRVIAEQREYYSTHVGDVMSKDIVTCDADDDSDEVLNAMKEHQIRRIPVVDSENRLIGIIAQADVARESNDEEVGEVVQDISQPGMSQGSSAGYSTSATSGLLGQYAGEQKRGSGGLKTGLLVAGGLGIGAGLIYLLDPRWARTARESVTNAAGTVRESVTNAAQQVQQTVTSAADSLRETVGNMTGGGSSSQSNGGPQNSGD